MKELGSINRAAEKQSPFSSSPTLRKKKLKRTRDVPTPPNAPLIMSQAAENMRRAEGKEVVPPPPHIDEFVGIMFKLGFITGDDTITPPREEIDDDSTRISEILYFWLNETNGSPTQAAAVGQSIGYHLLSRCIDKGASTSSLRNTINTIEAVYLQLSRDLNEYNEKPVEEKGKEQMGPMLRAVLGDYRTGREFPGLHRMDKVAHQLLAILVGASEEITGMLEKAKRTGI